MRDFGLALPVFYGMVFGVMLGSSLIAAAIGIGLNIMPVLAVWLATFLAVVAVGYIYAVKRRHDRMRRVMQQQPYLLAMHVMALFVWAYCIQPNQI